VVDGGDRSGARANEHEAAAADPARERLRHAEHRRCGDRGVDGVASVAQDVDRCVRREHVDRGSGASGADGGRLLDLRGMARRAARQREHDREDDSADGGEEFAARHRVPLLDHV
jgi:hypothetical protein